MLGEDQDIADAVLDASFDELLLERVGLGVIGTAEAADVAGVQPPWLTSPMWLARIGAPFMTAWANVTGQEPLYTAEALFALRTPPNNFDQSKAMERLGFSPTPTRDTLQAVYESFERLGQ